MPRAVAVGSETEGFGVVVGGVSRDRRRRDRSLDGVVEPLEVDRLGQVVEEPGLAALTQVFLGAEAAHGDAGHPVGCLDLAHELEPVAIGQLDVREQQVEGDLGLLRAASAAVKQSAVTTWWPRLRSTIAR